MGFVLLFQIKQENALVVPFFFFLTMSFIYCRLLLEMPVPVTSSPIQGSAVVCALLALEWKWHVARKIPSAYHVQQVRNYSLMLVHQYRFIISCLLSKGLSLDGTTTHDIC